MALAGQWQRLFLFLAVSICRCQRRGALAVAALQGSDTHRRGARCEANLVLGLLSRAPAVLCKCCRSRGKLF